MKKQKLKVVIISKNMMKKLTLWSAGVGTAIAGMGLTIFAHAQSVFTVPTSTAPTLLASIGAQIADSGTLLVIGVAAGVPLTFYVIHQLIGLLPKSRGGRR